MKQKVLTTVTYENWNIIIYENSMWARDLMRCLQDRQKRDTPRVAPKPTE
jgi:hypothetical protein